VERRPWVEAVRGGRRWPGMRSDYSWLPPHDHVTVSMPGQIGVSFTDHRGAVHERDGRAVALDVVAGMAFATGSQAVTWAGVDEPAEVVEVYPDADLLAAAAAEVSSSTSTGAVEIEPVDGVRDVTILGVAAVLKRAHVHGLELDDVQASTLAHRLAEHVVTTYCGLGGRRRSRRSGVGRFDRATLGRVSRLVDERMDQRLTLADLAGAAGLSPFHFARVFKASTGMAPHEYVTMCRMERAKGLLLATDRSVEQVAYGLGYSNLSHFRRMFCRCTGFAPSELRAR
jgi:AraC family transcriptional regulator